MSREVEGRQRAMSWFKRQPHCIGYHENGAPSCDGGDLVGVEHDEACPFSGRADLRGRAILPLDELLAKYAESELAALQGERDQLAAMVHDMSGELGTATLKAEVFGGICDKHRAPDVKLPESARNWAMNCGICLIVEKERAERSLASCREALRKLLRFTTHSFDAETYFCPACEQESDEADTLKHTAECPVTVAQALADPELGRK